MEIVAVCGYSFELAKELPITHSGLASCGEIRTQTRLGLVDMEAVAILKLLEHRAGA